MKYGYHPDREINAAVTKERIEAEKIDIEAGHLPSWWQCPECGRSHNRGHFGVIGNHRCMNCGYVGTDGVMSHTRAEVQELVEVEKPICSTCEGWGWCQPNQSEDGFKCPDCDGINVHEAHVPNVELSYGQTATEVNGMGPLDGGEVRVKANRTVLAISSSALLDMWRKVEAGSGIKEKNIGVGLEVINWIRVMEMGS